MKILYLASPTLWGDFNALLDLTDLGESRVGGTEQAVYHLIHGLRALGHDVTFADRAPRKGSYDVAVALNDPTLLDKVKAERKYVDSHQGDVYLPDDLTGVFVRSFYHQRLLLAGNPNLDPDDCIIVGNGVSQAGAPVFTEPEPGRVIWASSPDRGLGHLLRIWPRVLEGKPEAHLDIYYSLQALGPQQYASSYSGILALEANTLLRKYQEDPDLRGSFTVHGMVTYAEAQEGLSKAWVMPYTFDAPDEAELFCMSALEALNLKTNVIVPDWTAMSELWKDFGAYVTPGPPSPGDMDDLWIDWILRAMDTPPPAPDPRIASEYSWYAVVDRYHRTFEGEVIDFGKPRLLLVPDPDAVGAASPV